jgi:hypothetical protein
MEIQLQGNLHGVIGARPYWYTRCRSPWTRASEEQIKAATNYLKTAQEEQTVGQFKDVRYKGDTIYTVYMQGDTLVELLYEKLPANLPGSSGVVGARPYKGGAEKLPASTGL